MSTFVIGNQIIVLFKILVFRSKTCPETNTKYSQNKIVLFALAVKFTLLIFIVYITSLIDRMVKEQI